MASHEYVSVEDIDRLLGAILRCDSSKGKILSCLLKRLERFWRERNTAGPWMSLKWIDRFAWIAGVPLLAFTLSAAGIFGAWNKQASPEQSQGQSPKAIPKTGASAQSGSATKQKIIPRNEYVGDAVCGQCHRDKFDTYEKTAHHLTSQTVHHGTGEC